MKTSKLIYHLIAILIAGFIFTEIEAQKLSIAIIQVGEVDDKHMKISKDGILDLYKAKVKSPFKITVEEGMLSKTWDKQKPQTIEVINAKAVNEKLTEIKDKHFDLIIAITDSALTIGEKLISEKMLIRGFASEESEVATISTYKLKQESRDAEDFNMNLKKVVRHEIGHVLGLSHCAVSEHCLMLNGFEFENTIPEFCPACLEKIDKKFLKKRNEDRH